MCFLPHGHLPLPDEALLKPPSCGVRWLLLPAKAGQTESESSGMRRSRCRISRPEMQILSPPGWLARAWELRSSGTRPRRCSCCHLPTSGRRSWASPGTCGWDGADTAYLAVPSGGCQGCPGEILQVDLRRMSQGNPSWSLALALPGCLASMAPLPGRGLSGLGAISRAGRGAVPVDTGHVSAPGKSSPRRSRRVAL